MRINLQVRVPQVRVLDEDGNQLGVLPTHEALRQA
ncbi:MAG: translation initiation factor IF-3, partial [Candidatus Limnocylindrus sp.]